jgi:hypothetical protein
MFCGGIEDPFRAGIFERYSDLRATTPPNYSLFISHLLYLYHFYIVYDPFFALINLFINYYLSIFDKTT